MQEGDAKLREPLKNMDVVIEAKNIEIPGIEYPYNASLIARDGHFLLYFRYDTDLSPGAKQKPGLPDYYTNIGVIELDSEFNAVSPAKTLDTKSRHSEDPRAFEIDGELYIAYNDVLQRDTQQRIMKLSKLNQEGTEIINTSKLDIGLERMEKNWTPFETEDGLYFIYQIDPQIVIKIDESGKDFVQYHFLKNLEPSFSLPWETKWGILRGGTPAIFIDGEYLAFFHNVMHQKANNLFVYSMGAFTFEASLPFRITSISTEPFIFDGIFDIKRSPRASGKNFQCLYPAGIATGYRDGREVIFVSCGENDSGIKILTIDKEKLYASMTRIQR
jgi:predicted GH43/DUF377 family glycosyl hydrolase